MSRRCALCNSRDRESLEHRIANGDSIRVIAAEVGVNGSSIYRHLRRHVQPGLLAQGRVTQSDLSLEHFADRLNLALRDIADVREHARRTSDGRLLLAAIVQERETVVTLLDRLGVDGTEMLEHVGEAHALVTSLLAVMRQHPEAMSDIASHLRTTHHGTELADALEQANWRAQADNPKEIPA